MLIDEHSATPLYQQVRDQILLAIAQGRLRHGDRLDSVRQLAETHGLNPVTVQKAYDLLRADGVLHTDGRRGSTIHLPQQATRQSIVDTRNQLAEVLTLAVTRGVSAGRVRSLVDCILTELKAPPV